MTRIYQITIVILVLIVGFLLWREPVATTQPTSIEERVKTYPLLAPRILQEYHNDTIINFIPLRRKLHELTAPYGDTFALYFEYLPTGTSIGINEKLEFPQASLIKLPVVMAYYHMQERLGRTGDPEAVIEERDIDKNFGTLWQKGVGTKLQMSEVIRLALAESDNTAIRMIGRQVADEDFDAAYEGLDINLKMEEVGGAVITAKSYSSIIKALYFSSVLSLESSEEILGVLTQTKFTDKLPAGVEQGVPVAHKVGILGGAQYSDCGIVYLEKRDYLLCMVSQTENAEATQRMQEVSKAVFDFVKNVNR